MASIAVERDSASVQRVERFHPLDWMRVLAIDGVFVVHALHPFDTFDWHVYDPDRSELLSLVVQFLSSWGLGFNVTVFGR